MGKKLENSFSKYHFWDKNIELDTKPHEIWNEKLVEICNVCVW